MIDGGLLLEDQHAEQHHRYGGDRVGLEQVGRHTRAVADVVAHVVGDHGRVARIVLGDAGLDLADEVGADVGGLREDAAAEPSEHRDQRAAEAESDQRVDRLARGLARDPGQHAVVTGDADQRQADDQQAGDGAAAERDRQRRRDAAASRFGDARVGAHRDVHPDVAGGGRQQSADQETDRDADVLDRDQRDEQDEADAGDRRVLAVQIGARALLHSGRDRLHALVSGRQREQRARGQNAVNDGGGRAHERDQHAVVRQEASQEVLRRKLCNRGEARDCAANVEKGPPPADSSGGPAKTARESSVLATPGRPVDGGPDALLARNPEPAAALRRPRLAGLCRLLRGLGRRRGRRGAGLGRGRRGRLGRAALGGGRRAADPDVGQLQLRQRVADRSGLRRRRPTRAAAGRARTASIASRTCSGSRSSSVPGASPVRRIPRLISVTTSSSSTCSTRILLISASYAARSSSSLGSAAQTCSFDGRPSIRLARLGDDRGDRSRGSERAGVQARAAGAGRR